MSDKPEKNLNGTTANGAQDFSENISDSQQVESSKIDASTIIPKVKHEISKVAADPKQSVAIMIVGGIVALYLVYSMVFSSDADEKVNKEPKVQMPKVVISPTRDDADDTGPMIAALPEAPKLQDPSAPPPVVPTAPPINEEIKAPVFVDIKTDVVVKETTESSTPTILPREAEISRPPIIQQPAKPNDFSDIMPSPIMPVSEPSSITPAPAAPRSLLLPSSQKSPEDQKAMEERRKSSIMLISGQPTKTQEELEQNAAFKKRGDLQYTLGKGKIIEAALETAVNTDFSNEIRAVVVRDVYSERGRNVLIPKGSRIFGTFSGTADELYGRVSIEWNRVDLHSGYTVNFDGVGVDSLGRKGSEGRIDRKMKEKIGSVVLSTAVSIGFANILDKVIPPATTSSDATKVQTEAAAMQKAIEESLVATPSSYSAICTAAKNSITDKGSSSYLKVDKICQDIIGATGTDDEKAKSASDQLKQIANAMLITSGTSSTPTKAQEATETGMENFNKAVEDLVKSSDPKTTVTIDQGTIVKINVNRDYTFPRDAVSGSKVLQ
jgi:type IV secretion system protein VirB10